VYEGRVGQAAAGVVATEFSGPAEGAAADAGDAVTSAAVVARAPTAAQIARILMGTPLVLRMRVGPQGIPLLDHRAKVGCILAEWSV